MGKQRRLSRANLYAALGLLAGLLILGLLGAQQALGQSELVITSSAVQTNRCQFSQEGPDICPGAQPGEWSNPVILLIETLTNEGYCTVTNALPWDTGTLAYQSICAWGLVANWSNVIQHVYFDLAVCGGLNWDQVDFTLNYDGNPLAPTTLYSWASGDCQARYVRFDVTPTGAETPAEALFNIDWLANVSSPQLWQKVFWIYRGTVAQSEPTATPAPTPEPTVTPTPEVTPGPTPTPELPDGTLFPEVTDVPGSFLPQPWLYLPLIRSFGGYFLH